MNHVQEKAPDKEQTQDLGRDQDEKGDEVKPIPVEPIH